MVERAKLENRLGLTLASLTDRLASVRGGRLVLALGTGALNFVPVVGGAAGAAIVEYKNLYASASTNQRLSQLSDRVEQLSEALQKHTEQLDLLFNMIVDICQSLNVYLGDAAISKLDDLDPIAYSLLRPPAPHTTTEESRVNQLEVLLEEKQYELLLALLDEFPDLRAERSRLLRAKALYGLGSFGTLYALLRKEPLQSLSQEELESFIWASFELGYIVDATQGFLHHEKIFSSPTANLFRISIRAKFGRRYDASSGGSKNRDE
jgi:hypothetical protein